MRSRFLAMVLVGMLTTHAAGAWEPVKGQMLSKFAGEVTPDTVWAEYPRPQMQREAWQNLNGLWDYAIRPKDEAVPATFNGQILVPFAVESALSGVKQPVGAEKRLWYKRSFTIPAAWAGQRVLLNFGAVDWEATVWVNGQQLGSHRGGYDVFSMDITDALKPEGDQEIVVGVWDPTDTQWQPRGKQVDKPEGIWYTAVTGIWQTVWLEPVAPTRVSGMKLVPDIDASVLNATVSVVGAQAGDQVELRATLGGVEVGKVSGVAGTAMALPVPDAKLWSPDTPTLYDLEVKLLRGAQAVDTVKSYFGMRKIALAKDDAGVNRLFLNNAPLFQFGPLDQGWWPDGLYTAPSDAALRYDVEMTRKLGFNMARKHVKVEPARWYYHCDQLGLLVWQDMPSGDAYIGVNDPDITRGPESKGNFYTEWGAIMHQLQNHPSIVMWVPFNEGWGQFDVAEVTAWTKERDPSRLVNQTSGWADRGGSDVHDMHMYPGPGMFPLEDGRASVLGEFGGLGWPVPDHLWWDKRNWGYRTYESQDELRQNYATLIAGLRPLIGEGLAAAVYTQTTDVEGEVNGLMTYDRAVVKMEADWLATVNATVYGPAPKLVEVVPTSKVAAQVWRYTEEKPGPGWREAKFKDREWKTGEGVFGSAGTPGAEVRTEWKSGTIWLRREFTWPEQPGKAVYLRAHHDEDADVYINGETAARLRGYTTDYQLYPMGPDAAKSLKGGKNTIAVRCENKGGGQCIDVGIVMEE
ncbi:MAG: hypothetical protein HYV27_10340 [Candidatus Hydrogenedentes bacterium]|nr:hypothetical protein [Candidatus Hydrogenedentota bacterium]